LLYAPVDEGRAPGGFIPLLIRAIKSSGIKKFHNIGIGRGARDFRLPHLAPGYVHPRIFFRHFLPPFPPIMQQAAKPIKTADNGRKPD
jgi:hypothetical protein